MQQVSIHEAKTHLSAIIHSVETRGESVILCRHGNPVAEIVPIARGKRTSPSCKLKSIKIEYDPTEATEGEWSDVPQNHSP